MTVSVRSAQPVLALDIGGTKLAAGVVDSRGEVLSFESVPSETDRGPDAVIRRLFDLGREAIAASGVPVRALAAVGVGCGGPLDAASGVLLHPPHLPGWRDVPITRLATEEYALPAVLDNDGTAAAIGEHLFGVGHGVDTLVYLTVSTGIGGGVILGGRAHHGATGNGGELGHITVDWRGRRCRGCGRLGCLEAYASGTSIAERAGEAVAAGEASSLASCSPLTAADVAAAARAGDPLATRVWDETTAALACGVTSIVNLFEPDMVVLGGGVTRAGGQLLDPVRDAVRAQAMGAARATRIELAQGGDRVGVIGAAAVALERIVFDELPV